MVATAGGIGWLVVYRRHSKLCRWASFDGYFVNRWMPVCWHRMDDDVEMRFEWYWMDDNVGVDLAMSMMAAAVHRASDVFSPKLVFPEPPVFLFFISLFISHRMVLRAI